MATRQNDGGPAPRVIAELLRAHSNRPADHVASFVDALVFNWLVAGTDGHAKNYSLLFGARTQVRLAPLYDLGSALPYVNMDQRRLELAMKLGDTYRIREVAALQFEQLARDVELDAHRVVARARELAERARELAPVVYERERAPEGVGRSHDRGVREIAAHTHLKARAARFTVRFREGSPSQDSCKAAAALAVGLCDRRRLRRICAFGAGSLGARRCWRAHRRR